MRYALLLLALAVPLVAAPGDEFDDLLDELVDKEDYVRQLAHKALVKHGKKAVPVLVKALKSDNARLREQAVAVLGDIGREAADAVAAINELIKDGDPGVRKAAHEALKKIQGEAAKPLLPLAGLADGPREPLIAALEKPDLLGPAGTAVPLLLRILEKRDDVVRAHAGRAIGYYGEKAAFALPKLLQIGKTAAWPQRFAVIDALVGIGPAAVKPLFDFYREHQAARGEWLDEVFFRLGAQSIAVALPALSSEDKRVREAACLVLKAAGRRSEIALQNLVRALFDTTGRVRRAAAEALGALGSNGVDAIPALMLLGSDPERRAQREAVAALGSIVRASAARFNGKSSCAKPEKRAIELGRAWLIQHQAESGAWDALEAKNNSYSTGVTGLALLALLEGEPRRSTAVEKGLRMLVAHQDREGVYGTRASKHFMYNHATAALAMCIAYGQLRNPVYGNSAQKALDFIARARSKDPGGWRYKPAGNDSDTSMTGWMVAVVHAGSLAGLTVDPQAYFGTRRYIEQTVQPKSGAIGYRIGSTVSARPTELLKKFPESKTQAMTAAGGLAQFHAQTKPSLATVQLVLSLPPVWNPDDGSIDMYYWFHGTRLTYHLGGAMWTRWSRPLKSVLVKNQRGDGSWDPIGPWGPDGGRVYSTALMVMTLKTADGRVWPMRFDPPKGNKKLRPAYVALRNATRLEDERVAAAARAALLPFK